MFSMFSRLSVMTAVMALIRPGSFLWMTHTRLPAALACTTSGMFTLFTMLPFSR